MMAGFMSGFNQQAYALLRMVSGFLFMFHGTQKLFSWPLEAYPGMPFHVTYIAGPLELVGGMLIMIGLFTRHTAFLCSGLMAAAYWMAHGFKGLLPINNNGELAALYCFIFLLIASQGSGIWSVDDAMRKK